MLPTALVYIYHVVKNLNYVCVFFLRLSFNRAVNHVLEKNPENSTRIGINNKPVKSKETSSNRAGILNCSKMLKSLLCTVYRDSNRATI